MNHSTWHSTFRSLFDRCTALHHAGKTNFATWFGPEDKAFLASIGYREQEFFDFVDDHCRYSPEPNFETALLVAAVRRDYFLKVQHGKLSDKIVPPSALPAKSAAVEGIVWLPRLLAKAKAKLRGEMDSDTMYGCGGDRAFFAEYDIHPADFLRMVWGADENEAKVIAWVKDTTGRKPKI